MTKHSLDAKLHVRGPMSLPPSVWLKHIEQGLADDGYPWDFTAEAASTSAGSWKKISAHLYAKEPGVWVGSGAIHACKKVAENEGVELQFEEWVSDGTEVGPKTRIATLSANAKLLLALERPLINLVSFSSGIATATDKLVKITKAAGLKNRPRVSATRKTLPGYRDISIYSLRCGGGFAHRLGLSSGVLLKENHIAAAGGIAAAVEKARATAPHLLKIEVEVRDFVELDQALYAKADVIMLDNFSPESVQKACKIIENHVASLPGLAKPILEVSGGLNLSTLSSYCIEGVDVLSVGSLTHSVRSLDLTLLVEGLKIL